MISSKGKANRLIAVAAASGYFLQIVIDVQVSKLGVKDIIVVTS